MRNTKAYRNSLLKLDDTFREYQPGILINFFEPLIGWYAATRKVPFRIVSIAHQYIYLHPGFRFPAGLNLQALALSWFTRFTGSGSHRLIALSMYNLPRCRNKKLVIAPPLLRRELFQQEPSTDEFILIYLLNSGYVYDIFKYHKLNPDLKLVCFTDSREVREKHKGKWEVDETLEFHSLNDQKFLSLMASCKALVCTAGFESVCEAMYLNKPVMMVPVKGHYEQFCNAVDASRIGAGIHAHSFDLSLLPACIADYNYEKNLTYRNWVESFESRVMPELTWTEEPNRQARTWALVPYILALVLTSFRKLIS